MSNPQLAKEAAKVIEDIVCLGEVYAGHAESKAAFKKAAVAVQAAVNIDGIPILLAEPIGGNQVRAWCPFCDCYHLHGIAGTAIGELSHRAAHCAADTPFSSTGYYLKR